MLMFLPQNEKSKETEKNLLEVMNIFVTLIMEKVLWSMHKYKLIKMYTLDKCIFVY